MSGGRPRADPGWMRLELRRSRAPSSPILLSFCLCGSALALRSRRSELLVVLFSSCRRDSLSIASIASIRVRRGSCRRPSPLQCCGVALSLFAWSSSRPSRWPRRVAWSGRGRLCGLVYRRPVVVYARSQPVLLLPVYASYVGVPRSSVTTYAPPAAASRPADAVPEASCSSRSYGDVGAITLIGSRVRWFSSARNVPRRGALPSGISKSRGCRAADGGLILLTFLAGRATTPGSVQGFADSERPASRNGYVMTFSFPPG